MLAVLSLLLFVLQVSSAARLKPEHLSIRQKGLPHSEPKQIHAYVQLDKDSHDFIILPGRPESNDVAVAEASYSDASSHVSNFGQLRLSTKPLASDLVQMQAAGYLEGYVTAGPILDHLNNMKGWFERKGNGTQGIRDWLLEQDEWVQAQLQQHTASACAATEGPQEQRGDAQPSSDDPLTSRRRADCAFWYAVGLVEAQLAGMQRGFNEYWASVQGGGEEPAQITRLDLLLLNAFGDYNDLLPMFIPEDEEVTRDLSRLSPAAIWARLATGGHCSVLIKPAADLTDLYMGHVTWATYYSMVRLYKHYNFSGLSDPRAKGKAFSMSGYPGLVSSVDDFFLVHSTQLVVTETTNDYYNATLFNFITTHGTLSYQRTWAANMLAATGPEWVSIITKHSTQTYNNQYMIIDLKRFQPGEELQEGLLTIIELLPGYSRWEDMSNMLQSGFWPSFNIPYFKDAYDWAGYPDMAAALRAKGPEYRGVVAGLSYQLAPRAKILRRDEGQVVSPLSLAQVLRSAKWGNDSFSDGTPYGSMCPRGDLDPAEPKPYGCTDAKATSYTLAMRQAALAVNGPSTSDGLPPFSWSASAPFAPGPHSGMPDSYSFEYELQQP
mmetsp:Transcript_16858/g.36492  ORF Transcript_16858/g.36492 Transcript_16858/m.36492 type:complete len:608 (+) Transcript_16858:113-1936(+)